METSLAVVPSFRRVIRGQLDDCWKGAIHNIFMGVKELRRSLGLHDHTDVL